MQQLLAELLDGPLILLLLSRRRPHPVPLLGFGHARPRRLVVLAIPLGAIARHLRSGHWKIGSSSDREQDENGDQ